MNKKERTLVVILENYTGALTRVSSLFRRRNFSIHTLTAGDSEKPGISRMTVVVEGEAKEIDQVVKQLHKVIGVIEVRDITDGTPLLREMALIRVSVAGAQRTEITDLAKLFGARVVDISHRSMTLEITGAEHKVESFIKLLSKFGISEMVRSGRIAMARDLIDSESQPAGQNAISA